ncbi:MAG: CpXC domain-containing protein [bacterium]|jgi:tetratricopeptide (TPR) repeat protein|nr:CpXC domain-containing protein [candidate division KSB1 bacterium]MDH7560295.1 CpXC domain-containing protein [bacterium]
MSASYAQEVELRCGGCSRLLTTRLWLIVDLSEHPELAAKSRDGSLHAFECPHCGETTTADAPLLLYLPSPLGRGVGGEGGVRVLFSPAEGTSPEQDREQAGGLLARLKESLGAGWQDEWLANGLPAVPRPLLPTALSEGLEAVQRKTQEQVPPALRELLAELARRGVEIRSAEDLGRALEAHPDLRETLDRAAQGRDEENPRRVFEQHRALLRRCREVGIAQAFAEITGGGQGPGGLEIPPEFRQDIQRANENEQCYLQTGDLAALNQAAAAWERILDHPAFGAAPERFRLTAWNNAGGVFLRRYWRTGQITDLNRALELWQQAVAATPPDSPDRPAILNNLGTGLSDRYRRTRVVADLEEAIGHWQRAREHLHQAVAAGLEAAT